MRNRRFTTYISLATFTLTLAACDEDSGSRGNVTTTVDDDTDPNGKGDANDQDDDDNRNQCITVGSAQGVGLGMCELVIDPASTLTFDDGDGDPDSLAGRKFCTGTAVPTNNGWALMTAAHCDPAVVLGVSGMEVDALDGYAQPADDTYFWQDVAVRCGDGRVYKVVADGPGETVSWGGSRWETCAGGSDVALLHMDPATPNPMLFGVLDEALDTGAVVLGMNMNSLWCASILNVFCDETQYAAMHYRRDEAGQNYMCPTGYSYGSADVVNWNSVGVNSTHGDSGSGLVDLTVEGQTTLGGVIVSTADYIPRWDVLGCTIGQAFNSDLQCGSAAMPWPDQTKVVPGNVVHGCFPAEAGNW